MEERSPQALTLFIGNPFDDSLIASGSDDGKVRKLVSVGNPEMWLTGHRHSYGKYLRVSPYIQMQMNLAMLPL